MHIKRNKEQNKRITYKWKEDQETKQMISLVLKKSKAMQKQIQIKKAEATQKDKLQFIETLGSGWLLIMLTPISQTLFYAYEAMDVDKKSDNIETVAAATKTTTADTRNYRQDVAAYISTQVYRSICKENCKYIYTCVYISKKLL